MYAFRARSVSRIFFTCVPVQSVTRITCMPFQFFTFVSSLGCSISHKHSSSSVHVAIHEPPAVSPAGVDDPHRRNPVARCGDCGAVQVNVRKCLVSCEKHVDNPLQWSMKLPSFCFVACCPWLAAPAASGSSTGLSCYPRRSCWPLLVHNE